MLNKEQKAGVLHDKGPLLIIAGAGTGKTRVITQRILSLIEKGLASTSEILALTFTEKAATEMTERVDVAMPLGYEEVWIKTFHGFCEKVLRESGHEIGLSRDYRLLAKLEQWMFMKKHLFEFELDYFRPLTNPGSFIDTLISHFGRIKEEYISPSEYVIHAEKKLHEVMEKVKLSAQSKIDKKSVLGVEIEEVRKVLEAAKAYQKYQELMLAENCLDFGDLSYYTLKLFDERPSVLAHYQERFKYILVDEFQDTNYAQFKLLMMLSGGHKNICVVGDDDQSIFRWRGASLSNILQFNKEFPEAAKVILTENYRSSQNILDASHFFIKFNDPDRLEYKEKIPKNLRGQSLDAALPIEVVHFENYADEVGFVVGEIKNIVSGKKGKKNNSEKEQLFPYREIAVLVRANAHAIPFADEFKKAGIPFQIKTPEGLLAAEEIKDIFALVKALSDKGDDISLLRLLRIEIFGIKMSEILEILSKAKRERIHLSDVLAGVGSSDVLPGMESQLMKFVDLFNRTIEYSKNKTAGEVIKYFLVESGYLENLSKDFTLENQQKIENISSFSSIVWKFEKENSSSYITDFAEFLKLIEESHIPLAEDSSSAADVDAVQILTAHGAKGLEFDTVFVVNLVNHRFPNLDRKDPLYIPLELTKEIFPDGDYHLQEERRLFYVALTRAKRKLVLTYSDKYSGNKKWKRSQFLDELAESGLVKEVEGKKGKVDSAKDGFGGDIASPIDTAPKDWANKMSFSYSQIETFKTCPLKYGYRYAMNVPSLESHVANFGNSVHETLKEFYRALTEDKGKATFELMTQLYAKNWIGGGYENVEHEILRKENGREILKNFYEANSPFKVPAFIERNFSLKVGSYMLTGRIDRIDKLDDGTYEVIDYKTGKSARTLDPIKKLQLYIYALACRDVFGIYASKLSFYFLEDGEKVSLTKGIEELDSVKDEVVGFIDEIKKSGFAPVPGFYCRYCDYRIICPAV